MRVFESTKSGNPNMSRLNCILSILCCLTLAPVMMAAAQDTADDSGANSETEKATVAEESPIPTDQRVRNAFNAPPESVPLTKTSKLWIDRKRKRVYIDGYVAMKRGSLEMFACPMGTKEHESIVATLAKSREVHAALLAIEATPGTPVRHLPEFLPATGQVIRVWVSWRDDKDKFHVNDARKWVQENGTEKEMKADWVFAGSSFWQDPSDGREHYQADGGDMICVSNFSTAMMDVNISSSTVGDDLQFIPYESRIPKIGTPVRLVLSPIPNPTDEPIKPKFDPDQPPTEKSLPVKRPAKKEAEVKAN